MCNVHQAQITCCRNVGFLRYWTLSNVPLFVLATPMLTILFYSSFDVLQGRLSISRPSRNKMGNQHDLLRQAALPQLLLATTALTTSHVQMITRMGSGSPLWYLWLAQQLVNRNRKGDERSEQGWVQVTCRWMVMYALIQGGLYASFLPPA